MEAISERFTALDVFRGITICFMIIVNAPGSGAPVWGPLDHAQWFGFTPTDLVFPSFLFAVGNALSFSKYRNGQDTLFVRKVLKRTLIIFLLGYLMYWFPFIQSDADGWTFKPLAETRIMGVLQRIALCYLFAALIVRYFSPKRIVFVAAVLLTGYWFILLSFGTPGAEFTMLGNAGTQFDIFVMGKAHLYHDKGGPIAFDPEGLLSTLPAIVNVIGGYLAGIFIQRTGKNYKTVAMLFIYSALLICVALFWAQFFPLAKKLWTSSFTLLTIGIDLAILAVLLFVVEIRKIREGTAFFLAFGRNPLAIYLLSELLFTVIILIKVKSDLSFYDWINGTFFQKLFPGSFGSLVFAVSYMLLCWLVAYILDKRKIYIKI